MSAKPYLVLLSLLAVTPSAVAEKTHLEAAGVTLHVLWSDTPSCATPGVSPCPVGHDTQGTLAPGDDHVSVYHSMEDASVDVEGPVQYHFETDLRSDLRIEHPIRDLADQVLLPMEEALPAPIGDRIRVEPWDNSTVFWVRLVGLNGTSVEETEYGLSLIFPHTNRTGTTLPHGWSPEGDDQTDAFVAVTLEAAHAFSCLRQLGGPGALTCDPVPTEGFQETWQELTPNVVTGVAANRTEVRVGMPEVEGQALAWSGLGARGAPPGEAASRGLVERLPAGLTAGEALLRGAPLDRALPAAAPAAASPPVRGASAWLEQPAVPSWVLAAALLLLLPLALLFHRITGPRALENRNRARLLELVRERPGLLVGEAAAVLGIAYRSAGHHAGVLERAALVERVQAGRFTALYPTDAVEPRFRAALAVLRRGPQAVTLRAVQAHPGIGVTALARVLGCSKSSAHAKLASLKKQGLVTFDHDLGLRVTPFGAECLAMMPAAPAPASLTCHPEGTAPPQPL